MSDRALHTFAPCQFISDREQCVSAGRRLVPLEDDACLVRGRSCSVEGPESSSVIEMLAVLRFPDRIVLYAWDTSVHDPKLHVM